MPASRLFSFFALLLLGAALAAIPFLAFPGADLLELLSTPRSMHIAPDGKVVYDSAENLAVLFKGWVIGGSWLGSFAALFSAAKIALPRRSGSPSR